MAFAKSDPTAIFTQGHTYTATVSLENDFAKALNSD
jgi:hypothetical protein